MLKDNALPNKAVESGMVCSRYPDKVRGTVIELVAVQMMAYLVRLRTTPECRTHERVDAMLFVKFYMRIMTAALERPIERTELRSQLVPFAIDDVTVFVCEVRFAADKRRRNLFDNRYIHKTARRRDGLSPKGDAKVEEI